MTKFPSKSYHLKYSDSTCTHGGKTFVMFYSDLTMVIIDADGAAALVDTQKLYNTLKDYFGD